VSSGDVVWPRSFAVSERTKCAPPTAHATIAAMPTAPDADRTFDFALPSRTLIALPGFPVAIALTAPTTCFGCATTLQLLPNQPPRSVPRTEHSWSRGSAAAGSGTAMGPEITHASTAERTTTRALRAIAIRPECSCRPRETVDGRR